MDDYQGTIIYEWDPVEEAVIMDHPIAFPTLALAGEVGELANMVKKAVGYSNGLGIEDRKAELVLELGDCLFYLTQIATVLGVSMQDVARENVKKITARNRRPPAA